MLHTEAASAGLLVAPTLLAMVWANSPQRVGPPLAAAGDGAQRHLQAALLSGARRRDAGSSG